jgi:chemotaxis protein MotB
LARKKKHPEHVNHERWLVSYADFITLLFAFFTTLYAISTVDAQKMGKMVMSMRASFDEFFPAANDRLSLAGGGGEGSRASRVESSAPEPSKGTDATKRAEEMRTSFLPGHEGLGSGKSLGFLRKSVEAVVGKEALKRKVRTKIDNRGLVISLGEGGFFPSGSDQITTEGLALLDSIATSLAGTANYVRIEGHTDNVPIRTGRFPSNWELSTARATVVVSHLMGKYGFTPARLSAAGYSEYRPVETNDTDEGRSRNRRVDIIVLNPQLARLEPR